MKITIKFILATCLVLYTSTQNCYPRGCNGELCERIRSTEPICPSWKKNESAKCYEKKNCVAQKGGCVWLFKNNINDCLKAKRFSQIK